MIFALHWWGFIEKYKKWIRPAVFENVRKIMTCRSPELGFHLYGCPGCGKLKIIPHSCKSRFCPVCGKIATDKWAQGVLNDLLDVHYHHLVLTVPWELRPIMLMNRKITFDVLFKAAIKSISDWAKMRWNMRMGIIAVLHTFGGDLKFHPHIHLIVTGGGLSIDGDKWIELDPKFLMPHSGLKKRWRYNVVKMFGKLHKKGKLRFPKSSSYLKEIKCFNGLMSKIYKYMWYAFIGASLLDPTASVQYIGRYTKRAVLAEYRITYYDEKIIRFRFKDYAQGKTSYKTLSIFSFIRRIIQHIPDKWFRMIRHAGIFSNRWKSRYMPVARKLIGQKGSDTSVKDNNSSPNWRARQIDYTGKDPLYCDRCKQPMRFIGAFFGAHYRLNMIWSVSISQRLFYKPG